MTVEVPAHILANASSRLLQAALFLAALGRDDSAARILEAHEALKALLPQEVLQ